MNNLWLNLLMLANIRYEGVLFLWIALFFLAVLGYLKKDLFRGRANIIYAAAPLIFLALYCPKFLAANPFELKPDQEPFSLLYLIPNHLAFFRSVFNFNFYFPYAPVVDAIGFLALFYFIYLFFSKRAVMKKPVLHSIGITAVYILSTWLVIMVYYFGKAESATSSRYFAFFSILLSLSALGFFYRASFFRKKPGYVLAFSVLMFLLYHPVSMESRFSETQLVPREHRFVSEFVKKELKKDKKFLLISEFSGQYIVYDCGSVDFSYANKHPSLLKAFRRHLYRDVFVAQEIEYSTLMPRKGCQLSGKYRLQKIAESQNDSDHFVRISKVL